MKLFCNLIDTLSFNNPDVTVISHRGYWQYSPENSIESILLAREKGADIVKIDVQRTNSGTLYLMHDDTTDRTTNRRGQTKTLKDSELEHVFLRENEGGANASITNIQIPLLNKVLDAVRGTVNLNVSTKHRLDLDAVARMVLDKNMQDQVLLKMQINPTFPDLRIKQADWFGKLHFMPVVLQYREGQYVKDIVKIARLYNAKIIEVSFSNIQELRSLAIEMKRLGTRICCNTLDSFHHLNFSDSNALIENDAFWGRLIRSGVGAIQTDYAEELKRYLRGYRKRIQKEGHSGIVDINVH